MKRQKEIVWILLALVIMVILAEHTAATIRGDLTVRVQAGDCLWRIARRHGTTVAVLARYNGIKDPERIFTGQQLLIPAEAGRYRARSSYASRSHINPTAKNVSPSVLGSLYNMVRPVTGRLSSGYGMRWGRMHRGIDLACPAGTSVRTVADGRVVSAGWRQGYGWLVEIDHGQWRTRYAHNSKLLVSPGDEVKANQTIASSGATGRVTGPHLHFEVIVRGRAVDPHPYLKI